MTKINKEGWEIKKLGEVASFLGGGTPSKKNDAYYTGDIPWATVRDMVSFELSETEYHITPEAVEESATNIIPKGTIVISTHVGLGKICVLMQDTAINQDLKAVIFNDEGAQLKGYFAYWYKSIADFIVSNGKGATVKGVTLDFMRNLPIPLPPLPIQRRIVEELDEINAIISAKKQQLTKLDELAQSIFYDMFGDPVANEKGWEVKKLGLIANVKVGPFGSMLHKEDYIANGIPLVNPMHMKDFKIVVDPNFTVSKEKADELANYLLEENDVVFARRGDIGRCVIVAKSEEGYLCGTGSLFVRFTEEIASTYIMYLVRSSSFTKELINKAQGQTMLNLNSSIVENLQIPLPPLPLQETFATRISAIEDQKSAITASIEKMQTLLDARMQEYFG